MCVSKCDMIRQEEVNGIPMRPIKTGHVHTYILLELENVLIEVELKILIGCDDVWKHMNIETMNE